MMEKSATQWMTEPLRKYATFSGRARRKEYWWYQLFAGLVVVGLTIVDSMLFEFDRIADYGGAGPLVGLAALALIVPSIAVSVRRLHDLDKSAWYLLIGLIPLIGGIILFIWYVSRGTVGDNGFGSDPLAVEG